MKNAKGFTLVELLAVLVILGIIMAITIPLILNQFNQNKDKTATANIEVIETAALLYFENNINSNATYCVTLQTLVDLDYLDKSIVSYTGETETNLTQFVEIRVDSSRNTTTKVLSSGINCTPLNN